ncbi:hypothetical protein JTB14_000191 [Gonioctena quinquepunctata]|nr:hypothetical protein JTB14_000191 [Gonioctena quinquepunctata]
MECENLREEIRQSERPQPASRHSVSFNRERSQTSTRHSVSSNRNMTSTINTQNVSSFPRGPSDILHLNMGNNLVEYHKTEHPSRDVGSVAHWDIGRMNVVTSSDCSALDAEETE